jgi:TonB family protein
MITKLFSPRVRPVIVLALTVALFAGLGLGEDGDRKVRLRVSPLYPELAKRVNATGTVRLEVEVAPNGEVRNVKALGGHPLLIPAAQDAIRKWKYEPAKETTTAVVEFRFGGTQ